jgi:hypothetical protein
VSLSADAQNAPQLSSARWRFLLKSKGPPRLLCRTYKAVADPIWILYAMATHVFWVPVAHLSTDKESGHDRESIRLQRVSNRRIEQPPGHQTPADQTIRFIDARIARLGGSAVRANRLVNTTVRRQRGDATVLAPGPRRRPCARAYCFRLRQARAATATATMDAAISASS